MKQNHSLFKNHTFLNKLEDSSVFPVENCSPSEETIRLCDAASRCPSCTVAGQLLHGALAAQELGSGFTVPMLHRTAQRYLVALTLARVQSDKRSGEPEEPVWEWKWVALSVPQFYCSAHSNKEQLAGTVQLSKWLMSTTQCQQKLNQSSFLPPY